jgi:hypothetical protein
MDHVRYVGRHQHALQLFATPLVALFGLALASTALYWFGITQRYPMAEGLLAYHRSWPGLVDFSLRAGWAHAAVYALLILCYMLALRVASRISARQAAPATMLVVAGWILYSASLLPAYPGESLDIFDYLVRGQMQVLFGASPLATAPNSFPQVPFYRYATWKEWIDAYGPLWEYSSGMVARTVMALSPASVSHYILGYRLLAIAMAGVCSVAIALIVRRTTPHLVVAALVAWLWNPLLLISTALGAHNDGLMLALTLLALWCVQRERWLLGLLALGLAAHVKIMALLLLPVLALWMIRRRGWWRALATGAASLALLVPLSWALYAPLGGWKTVPRMLRERAILTYNSPANVVYDLLRVHWEWQPTPARQVVIRGSTLLFLVVGAALLAWFWRRTRNHIDGDAPFWRAGIAVTMAYLLVGCFWFQAWYVMWVLALAALLPAARFTVHQLPLFSLGALWSNVSTDFLNQDPQHRFQAIQIDSIMVAVLWLPLLCTLVVPPVWQMVQQPHASYWQRWRRLQISDRLLDPRHTHE